MTREAEAIVVGRPVPRCPIRDEPCSLCIPGVSGPQDCGLVYLVRSDPLFAAELAAAQEEAAAPSAPAPGTMRP